MHNISFYQSHLESLGFNRDGDLLVYADDGTPAYFTYNKEKRRLALPTSAMIKNGMEDPNGKECHAFHPLCESVLQGESGTIRFLKKAIRLRVWSASIELIDAILDVSAEDKPIRLAAYKKFMSEVICEGIKDPKLDEKLRSSWNALKAHISDTVDPKKHTSIFIASDMSIDGMKYVRVANFKHLFEEETLDDTATYFGARMQRKQDKVIIHRLLTTIFGWYPSLCGSNDNRPYFGCLARGWAQYVVNYNQIVKGLRDHTALKPMSDEWIGELDNLKQYDGVIQTLPYNTGSNATSHDTTKQEYRLSSQTPQHAPETVKLASVEKAPEPNSLDSYFDKHAGKTDRSGKVDLKALPLVQQRALQETGNLIGRTDTPSVADISLVQTFGGQRAPARLGSLHQDTGNSLLGGNTSRLGGLGNVSGNSLLDGGGGGLGQLSGTKPSGGFRW